MTTQLDKNKEQLGRTQCAVEIDVLNDVSLQYASAVESNDEQAINDKGQLVFQCNDVIYKKLVDECQYTFDEAEKLVQALNLEALKSAHKTQTKPTN